MGVHQYSKRLSYMERLIRLPVKLKYFEQNLSANSFKAVFSTPMTHPPPPYVS
ncbi:hypothetical protein C7R45_07185, partial [Staphylococcus aureus]